MNLYLRGYEADTLKACLENSDNNMMKRAKRPPNIQHESWFCEITKGFLRRKDSPACLVRNELMDKILEHVPCIL